MGYGAWKIGLFSTKGSLEIVHQTTLIEEGKEVIEEG